MIFLKRIGLDIDDTISNTHFVLMKYAIKYNLENDNKPMLKCNTNDFSKVFGWSLEETNSFFKKYYLTALDELMPKYGVKETLDKLREEGRKIIFITVRNDKECAGIGEARRLTLEWFKKHEIPFDELYVDIRDKKQFCAEKGIDAFIDDSISTVTSVKTLGIPTFIAMNDFNKDFNDDDIIKVDNMEDFYNKIHEIEELKSMEVQ